MAKERIHIFIPVYYREKVVIDAIDSILATYESADYDVRIILINNGAEPGLLRYMTANSIINPDVVLVDYGKNEGKTNGVNKAFEMYSDCTWVISCDSDIYHLEEGWPGKLVDCYKALKRVGMVSIAYTKNHSPMNEAALTNRDQITVNGTKYSFKWGRGVAGGCFVTSVNMWKKIGGYKAPGVYGGVDGTFVREVNAAGFKCGYIEQIHAIHKVSTAYPKYMAWKAKVQNQIRASKGHGTASDLGNEKGYWDG